MNVVIVGIVTGEHLEWIKGQTITAMIVNRFHGTEREQEDGLPDREIGHCLSHHGAKAIEEESLKGVVVQCTISIGHIEPVVHRVEVFVEELVYVHSAMEEILPSVDDKSVARSTEMGTQVKEEVTYSEKKICAAGMTHQYNQCITAAPRSDKN